MSWIAVAGVAVTAVGSYASSKGAAESAEAVGAANAENAANEEALYNRQSFALNKLTNQKQDKLSNLGNIFDRMESTGAFGDTNTLKNLRKAQSDYSALAAGDFSGFEQQLRQSLSDSLIATAGAGAPIGTFAGLAAQDQMNLRGQGIQTTMGISDYLSNEAYKLLGNEFGIMDQKFEAGYKMDREMVSGMAGYRLGEAATQGVAQTAYGNAIQQTGSSVIGAYNNYQNMQTVRASNANQLEIAKMAYGNRSGQPNRNNLMTAPASYSPSMYSGTPSYPGGGSQPPSSLPDIGLPPPDSYNPDGTINIDGGVLPSREQVYGVQPDPSGFMNAYNNYGARQSGMSLLSNVGANIVLY